MMDDNRIISRLKSVIKDGHLPCRFTEKYTQLTAERVNCFAHACFNLSNEQIRLCLKQSDADFFKLSGRKIGKEADAEDILMNIICSSGLNVEKTKVKINDCVLKNNQWIVTLFFTKYFGTHPHLMRDFHFLLQEKNKFWTAKNGLASNISVYPQYNRNEVTQQWGFKHYGTYIITNPNACEEIKEDKKVVNKANKEIHTQK